MKQEKLARNTTNFDVPKNVEHARALRQQLVNEINDIRAQLSSKSKVDPLTGTKVDEDAYQQWRSRAVWAMTQRESRLASVKNYIREKEIEAEKADISELGIDVTSPDVLLKELYKLLNKYLKAPNLPLRERSLVRACRDHIDSLSGQS